MLYVRAINRCDLVNNPLSSGLSSTIWFSGCTIGCKGCHNPSLAKRQDSDARTVDAVLMVLGTVNTTEHDTHDVILLGGEPLEQDIDNLVELCVRLRLKHRIWLYTGKEFSEVPDRLLPFLYIVKCGKYDENLKTSGFPSSSNQKVMQKDSDGKWVEIKLGGNKE